ncbi:TonB-dependent receptor plug domain-containing protein [Candidatus Magnetaquiglobus chichijimensis]|uniref:TonB-dependent receptor plug domain-containing protein n=1 Tax=Candidatus Magnetaquiglobus chichijimensis TaxID=3141448 RepID=UPI003B97B3D1
MTASLAVCLVATTLQAAESHQTDETMERLLEMNVTELAGIKLSTLSRKEQKLVDTAAAVTVIDAEEIRRSGMTSIPELLRMVPGMNVTRINASTWAVSTRGFQHQFSNKLLVLMDGRTLYTPLFAGVNWNLQDIPLADVERIEVVRGPGASLWGTNAVNGVINIVTRKTADTQGNRASITGGTVETLRGELRHGGTFSDTLHYRVYASGMDHADFRRADNTGAHDDWNARQQGFRLDWQPTPRDEATLQGELFAVKENPSRGDKQGGHLLGRWSRDLSDTRNLTAQLYYDHKVDTSFEVTRILDLDTQYGLRTGRHVWIMGMGYRLTSMELDDTALIQWRPKSRRDHILNLFAQDEIALASDWILTLGGKIEYQDEKGIYPQPNARLLWRASDTQSVWGAVSHAVRIPSSVDQDFRLTVPLGAVNLALRGNPEIEPEKLLAHELGYRFQPRGDLSLEIAAFYNRYDHLISLENLAPLPTPPTLRQFYANKGEGTTYGLETAVDWRVSDTWHLTASHAWLKMNLDVVDGSTDTTTTASANDIPRHQWQLRSRLDLPHDLELDSALFHATRIRNLAIPATTRLDLRIGWRPTASLTLSLAGQNLLDDRHPEFTAQMVTPSEMPRAFLASAAWRF